MQRCNAMHLSGQRRCIGASCGAARRPTPAAAAAATRAAPGRRAVLDVCCKQQRGAAGAARRAGGRGRASTKKGFAKPAPKVLAEPWEAELPHYYRAYYKAGFKPPRFTGPIELEKREDGSVDVVTVDPVVSSQLLAVAPALVYLEGAFGETPSVEDLHSALLARGAAAPAGVARVLHLLPRAAPAADGEDDAAAAAAGPEAGGGGADGGESAPPISAPLAAAVNVFDLDPKLWASRAAGRTLPASAPPPELPPAGELLRALQASCYGEEYLDPASSQLRHEAPAGFLGVWPELAAMRHSCAPNTAVAVVGGGHALIHAARDLEAGDALTTNKIGSAILGPLAVRQAAVRALTGRGCDCGRCAAERALPEEVQAQLADLHARMGEDWAAALDAAAAAGDEGALAGLWEDVTLDVDSLVEALQASAPDAEVADALAAGAYSAAELAWSLEELTQREPDVARLAAAVRMLRAAAPGSESHVAAALQLHGIATARVTEMLKAERGRRGGRTAAAEKRLLAKVVAGNEQAEGALVAFYEAMYIRYGFIPEEGLLPQLQSGLELFYAGLEQLGSSYSAAAGGGVPAERELMVDGIPVTVIDRVGVSLGGGGGGGGRPDYEMSSSSEGAEVVRGGVRLRVVPVEAAAAGGGGAAGGGLAFGDDGGAAAGAAAAQARLAAAAAAAALGEGSLHEDGPLVLDESLDAGAGPETYLAP